MSRLTQEEIFNPNLDRNDLSLPTENQKIVRSVGSIGHYLTEVESSDPTEENFLVLMPMKLRKIVMVMRGDFMLVEPINEGGMAKAEIVKILTSEHRKKYSKEKVWPERFKNIKQEYQYEDETLNNGSIYEDRPRQNFVEKYMLKRL